MIDFRSQLGDPERAVVAEIQGDRPVLVAFGGIRANVGMPPFEFVASTQHLDVDHVFVRDLRQRFCLDGVTGMGSSMPEVAASLADMVAGNTRRVFVGNCAGGYAALVLGPCVPPT